MTEMAGTGNILYSLEEQMWRQGGKRRMVETCTTEAGKRIEIKMGTGRGRQSQELG
jgi:hypothetical protein